MAQPDASRLYLLADDVARHEFSIPIARTMKLQEIQEAHRIFEQGGPVDQAAKFCWFREPRALPLELRVLGLAPFGVGVFCRMRDLAEQEWREQNSALPALTIVGAGA